jgi:hypothetical protein
MKKYLFGLTAIVLAVVAVAFTTPKKSMRADVFFRYTGSTFTESAVENPANYVEVADLSSCDGVDEKACRIKVDASDVQGTAPNRTLKSGTVIVAAPFGSAPNITYYVTVASDVLAKSNNLQ